jgi:hypothetical protein
MRPRLVLARELLTSDGVIFVSIDDHEQAYLKVMMDGIFGEDNFLNTFVWVNKLAGRQLSTSGAAGTKEYILCYARQNSEAGEFRSSPSKLKSLMPTTYKGFNYKVEHDEYGPYIVGSELYNSNSIFNETTRRNLVFDIYYNPKTHAVKTEPVSDSHIHPGFIKISPHRNNNGINRYHAFRWSRRKVEAESHNLVFLETKKGWKVHTKVRDVDSTAVKDIITDITTTKGSKDIEQLGFGSKDFDYPKPISLIKVLLEAVPSNKNAIILDFFAGSGTTGHAVAELNKEDGGHRKCILVTNNFEQDGSENGIARGVTAVRLRRVLTGEGWADGEKHDPLPGNLRYYRVGFKALADDADVFTGAFTAPGDIAGVIALAHGTHDVVSAESLADACPALAAAVVNGRAMVLTNGHGDRVLVYSDAVAVMNGADEYEDVLSGFREWAGDEGTVYLASLDESDDDGVVYPLPYVRTVRRTGNGLERQGLLAREK